MKVTVLELKYLFETPGMLQEWKGSILHGAFGRKLKEEFCLYPKRKDCYKCKNAFVCPYGYLFHYQPESIEMPLSKCRELPKPIVFDAQFDEKTHYTKGECLRFRILLFGRKAGKYVSILKEIAGKIGAIGRGKRQGYGKISLIEANKQEIEIEQKQKDLEELKIKLETPTIILQKKSLIISPKFYEILKSASRRYSAMQIFHGRKNLNIEWKEVYTEWENKVESVEEKFEHVIFGRYTNREQKFVGIVGEANYKVMSRLENCLLTLDILEFVKYAHIGKFASFGLGKIDYEVIV